MKQKGQKEKLKPISFYGLDTRDVIRAFMQVKPERIRELEEEERKSSDSDSTKKGSSEDRLAG